MSNELWFEAAATQGRGRVVVPTNRPPVSVPSVPTRPVDPVTQTVICNKCDKGFGVANMFPGTVCPQGWTLDKDPCNTPIVKGPPVLVDPNPNIPVYPNIPVLEEPVTTTDPIEVIQEPITEVPVTPTPVVVVNPEPVQEKKDNNDLILYIAIGVGAYLLLKK